MYEIKEKRRKLPDGTEITTYTREILSANVLEVEAGTTGFMGGDTVCRQVWLQRLRGISRRRL